MPAAIQIALVVVVFVAGWCDLRTRHIPNWITAPGAAIGLVLQIGFGGFRGLAESLAGLVIGLAIFMVLHLVGRMGAGDVKLFSAVGALTGPRILATVFIFTALLGGVAALA